MTDTDKQGEADWPNLCPFCGERFGWGPEWVFLSIVTTAPFDEALPCCGRRATGRIHRDGTIRWDKRTVAAVPVEQGENDE